MNSMFRSFLKSMQTKSQDAQNPGLWVNGNRLPVYEQNVVKDTTIKSEAKPVETQLNEKNSWVDMAVKYISGKNNNNPNS